MNEPDSIDPELAVADERGVIKDPILAQQASEIQWLNLGFVVALFNAVAAILVSAGWIGVVVAVFMAIFFPVFVMFREWIFMPLKHLMVRYMPGFMQPRWVLWSRLRFNPPPTSEQVRQARWFFRIIAMVIIGSAWGFGARDWGWGWVGVLVGALLGLLVFRLSFSLTSYYFPVTGSPLHKS
jgi:hypothetical protein